MDTREGEMELDPEVEILDKPYIGQVFITVESAYDFYNAYTGREGFSIRVNQSHYNKGKTRKLDCKFCCQKQGAKRKDDRRVGAWNPRNEIRCGCDAFMSIRWDQDKEAYVLNKFYEQHNHILHKPECKHLLRSQRSFTLAQAVVARLGRESGLKTREVYEYMGNEVGGIENLGFIKDDMKRHLQTVRQNSMKHGEAALVLEHFQYERAKNPAFYSAYLLDSDEKITNIFLADARMIEDYNNFGDVVAFDTTYKTNNAYRPCAVFAGFNHFCKTVIFGGALLYDETGDSFEWLFRTFLHCMSQKKPQTIFTDQAQAIAIGLTRVMPETKHCLCIWHLTTNLKKHYGILLKDGIVRDWNDCMHVSMSPDQFDAVWKVFTTKWRVQDEAWFKKTYELREKWADAYLREVLTLGMTSTQLSEGINACLKQWLRSDINMIEFFERFGRVVRKKRLDEQVMEYNSRQKCFPERLKLQPMLLHAAQVYTLPLFERFKMEYEEISGLVISGPEDNEGGRLYRLWVYKEDHNVFEVVFCEATMSVTCNCAKYVMCGYLCCHSLKVLDAMNIKNIPDQYILKRWRKVGRDHGALDFTGLTIDVEPDRRMSQRYHSMVPNFVSIASRAFECEEATQIVVETLNDLSQRVSNICLHNNVDPQGGGPSSGPSPGDPKNANVVRGFARKQGKEKSPVKKGDKRPLGWYEVLHLKRNKRNRRKRKVSLAGFDVEAELIEPDEDCTDIEEESQTLVSQSTQVETTPMIETDDVYVVSYENLDQSVGETCTNHQSRYPPYTAFQSSTGSFAQLQPTDLSYQLQASDLDGTCDAESVVSSSRRD